MGATEVLVAVAVVVAFAVVVVLAVRLARSRDRVMGYHDIKTPRVNESSHGGGPVD